MKRIFALPCAILSLGVTLVCLLFVVLMVLLATPFWLVELLTKPTALKSATLAKLSPDESALDWLYSLCDPRGRDLKMNFVRLWGIEFRYP